MVRNLRVRSGMSLAALSQRSLLSKSRLSRVESGREPEIIDLDVESLVAALDPAAEEAQQLRVQHRITGLSPESYRYIDHQGVDLKQLEILERERNATAVRVFEPFVIPGLLQTPAYAHALFIKLGIPWNDVEPTVRARLRRQELLADAGRQFRLIIGEVALYSAPGSLAVQIQQLDHILTAVGRANVKIGVLPTRAGMPVSAATAFTMMDDSYVSAETTISEQQINDPEGSVHLRRDLRRPRSFGGVWSRRRRPGEFGEIPLSPDVSGA